MTTKTFNADLARYNAAFEKAGAVVEHPDGFTYVDESKLPASMVKSYRNLMRLGFAQGLV